ncbi:MAG: ABC-2 family transporter protein [Treponema sp.]|jgi:ABC-2 type transport system permease protein|nr:ABC-2 family transporter protein [Treponema sp.]
MKKLFSIYKTCVTIAVAQALSYRLNFVLSLLITLGFNILFPLVTILIYGAGASFPGWTFYEVLLIQSVYTLSLGFACIMFSSVLWATMQHIREGSFEVVLLKPLNPLFFLIASNFDMGSFGLIIGGGVLFGFSLAHTGLVSIIAIPQFLLLFAGGFAVMAGLQMIMAATSFKWVGNSRIPEIFDSIMTFGKYPVTIFPNVVKGITTFVIPVSMIGFFPASALLGRLETTALFAVIPCGLFMLFGIWLYHYMVRLYEGVGG